MLRVVWRFPDATGTFEAVPTCLGFLREGSVQVEGDFGATGAAVLLVGSNTGTTFVPLRNRKGTDLFFRQADLDALDVMPGFVKPVVTDPDPHETRLEVALVGCRA